MDSKEINKIDNDMNIIKSKLKEVGIELADWSLLYAGQTKSISRVYIGFSKKLTLNKIKNYIDIIMDTVNYFNILNLYCVYKKPEPFNNRYCRENIDANLVNYQTIFQFERYPELSLEFKNMALELTSVKDNDIRISNLVAIRTFLNKIYNNIKAYKEEKANE